MIQEENSSTSSDKSRLYLLFANLSHKSLNEKFWTMFLKLAEVDNKFNDAYIKFFLDNDITIDHLIRRKIYVNEEKFSKISENDDKKIVDACLNMIEYLAVENSKSSHILIFKKDSAEYESAVFDFEAGCGPSYVGDLFKRSHTINHELDVELAKFHFKITTPNVALKHKSTLYNCHKEFLSFRSIFFADLFKEKKNYIDSQNDQLPLIILDDNFHSQIFDMILCYIYHGILNIYGIKKDYIMVLYNAALHFGLESLAKKLQKIETSIENERKAANRQQENISPNETDSINSLQNQQI